jgi:putative ABC transport system permease protein
MRFGDIIKSANANLLRNKGRSFLTVLAIFIGSFTIILTSGINTGVNGYIDKQMDSAGGEDYLEVVSSAAMSSMIQMGGLENLGDKITEYNPAVNASNKIDLTSDDLEAIGNVDGVESVDIYHRQTAEYITKKDLGKKYLLNISEMPSSTIKVDMIAGRMVSPDAGQYQIALAPGYPSALGFESDGAAIGNKVLVGIRNLADKKVDEVEAVVTGVQNKSVISMGYSWINKSLDDKLYETSTTGLPAEPVGASYMATVILEPDLSTAEIQAVKDDIAAIQNSDGEPEYIAMTMNDQVDMMKTFFSAITTVLTIFGVIALLAASIGIVNTLFMAVQERTREIGLMKAMGLGNGEIRLMFNLEASALGFWGALLGA